VKSLAHSGAGVILEDEVDSNPSDGASTIEWVFALINRNLMNYPLARDRRLKLNWQSGDGGWLCDLTDNIQLQLPATIAAECRVCPNALDMNVLFHLLMLRRKTGRPDLRLSQRDLIKAVGLTRAGANRKRVRFALQLWSHLSITFQRWYADGNRQPHVLPPPIQEIKPGRPMQIIMHDGWVWHGFHGTVPLPLPNDAVAQNLILYLLTQPGKPKSRHRKGTRDRRLLYKSIGLTDHSESANTMERSLDLARRWFKRHGGHLKPTPHRNEFTFRLELPKQQEKPKPQQTQAKKPITRLRLDRDTQLAKIKQHWSRQEFDELHPTKPLEEKVTMIMEDGRTLTKTKAEWAKFDAEE
jgi:hypothetical protein